VRAGCGGVRRHRFPAGAAHLLPDRAITLPMQLHDGIARCEMAVSAASSGGSPLHHRINRDNEERAARLDPNRKRTWTCALRGRRCVSCTRIVLGAGLRRRCDRRGDSARVCERVARLRSGDAASLVFAIGFSKLVTRGGDEDVIESSRLPGNRRKTERSATLPSGWQNEHALPAGMGASRTHVEKREKTPGYPMPGHVSPQ